MASLGDLGVAKPKVADSFGWFGAEIRINPNLTDLVLMDFAEKAAQIDEDSPEVLGFVKMQMRLVIHTEDFDAFWSAALENGQNSADLMAVMKTIVERTAQRPTQLPADSSAGQPRTVVTSPDVSSLPDTAVFTSTLEKTRADLSRFRDAAYSDSPLTAMDRTAVASLSGRPELMLVADRAARERAAERAVG